MKALADLLTEDLFNLILLIIVSTVMILSFKLKLCVGKNKFIAFYKYDFLTGLELRQDLDKKITQLFHSKTPFHFTLVDINDLHSINKIQGYRAGDKVIQAEANTLKKLLQHSPNTFIYRIGGDEFVVISDQIIHDFLAPLTKSSYCSTFFQNDKTYDELFDEVDSGLIIIKQNKIKNGDFKDRRKRPI